MLNSLKIYVLDHNSDQLLRIQQHWLEVVDAKNIDVCVNFQMKFMNARVCRYCYNLHQALKADWLLVKTV